MAKKITTKTGAVYHITDNGFWKKNDGDYDRVVFAHGITSEDLRASKRIDNLEVSDIEVGNHLYIGGYDLWWLSTPIVKIEEYEETG